MDFRLRPVAIIATTALLVLASAAQARLLDSFEDISRWEALASEGAEIEIDSDTGFAGKGLRLDFNFHATGGYVNVKKKIALQLPENYSFRYHIRGSGPANNLEFKLLDPTGRNVWWRNDRAVVLEPEWQVREIWQSQIRFAWGPNPGPPRQVGYLEITIKANKGGAGSVWIDELSFQRHPPDAQLPWPPRVSGSVPLGPEATAMFDRQLETVWHSDAASPERQWLEIDLTERRLYGGLIIDWDAQHYPTSFAISVADEPGQWRAVFSTTQSRGRRSYVYLPSTASRYLRLDLLTSRSGAGYGIREIALQPYSFSESINSFFTTMAGDARLGAYPKYLSERQTYWTVAGVSGDRKEALINEEGMIEVDAQSFSIEPMLYVDGHILTWNDVTTTQTLLDGYLPIPAVTWESASLRLEIQPVAAGGRGASTLYVRYRVTNTGGIAKRANLYLAIRPFQVNPPWQSLDTATGATPIWGIERIGSTVLVRTTPETPPQRIELRTPPTRFGAAPLEEGGLLDFVGQGQVPPQPHAQGGMGFTTGVIEYGLELDGGESTTIDIAVPWYVGSPFEDDPSEALEQARRTWSAQLDGIGIEISRHPEIVRLMRSTVAYILINRDEAAIQPGSRTYSRSWIRDGALTSMALLEMGLRDEVREYLRWFASKQFTSGRVPCCVDDRGPDPTPEYDSDGELIFAIAEYYRYTGDAELVYALWGNVVAAVGHIQDLRAKRMTERYQRPSLRAFYGLLPESISHEGYAAHPVHSYWDDFFALRGLRDAVTLATVVGDHGRAQQYEQWRAELERNVVDSIGLTVAVNAIRYIPGSVELGDFDPTATSILATIGIELPGLAPHLLPATFERYYRFFQDRQSNASAWTNYAPYEFRNVGAFVQLGQRERANEVLRFLMSHRRPQAWNQWPEIVWRDLEAPRFIGDMPHTWVGSSFLSAVRMMLVYEKLDDNQLVLAAGVASEWLDGDNTVVVRDLPTELGRISYELRRDREGVHMEISGELRSAPRLVLRPPLPPGVTGATIDGEPAVEFDSESLLLDRLPATVVFKLPSETHR